MDSPDLSRHTPFSATFLGTGTSTGVPMIGCDCAVCRSSDPRDNRLRPSLLVRGPLGNILIDTTPEMRLQMLREDVGRIEAALITHTHADHIFGLDDLRQFTFRHRMPIPVHGTAPTLAHIRSVFAYCFEETQAGGGKPKLDLVEIRPYEAFALCGLRITPVPVWHGELSVLAFVIENTFAYVTDVSAIPPETRPFLQNLDTLVLGAVRFEPHPTHFHLDGALQEMRLLGPRRGFLTHLSHHFSHEAVSATLPANVALAHDGLTLSF